MNSFDWFFDLVLSKPRTYFCVPRIDGKAKIFPPFYATTGTQTHVCSSLRDLKRRFTHWATTAGDGMGSYDR